MIDPSRPFQPYALPHGVLASVRAAVHEFVQRHAPHELADFDITWTAVIAARLPQCDPAINTSPALMGLPFDGPGGARLISVCASYAAVVVAQRLRATLPRGLGAVGDEFATIIKAIGGSPDLARKLATELGPALIEAVEKGTGERIVLEGGGSLVADDELWSVDALTSGMLQTEVSSPRRSAMTLERVHADPEYAPEKFRLYVDESKRAGLEVRQEVGASPEIKGWDVFAGQPGSLLRLMLSGMSEGEYRLDAASIVDEARCAGAKDPKGRARTIRSVLRSRLGAILDELLIASTKGGYDLGTSVPYCWIRRPKGPSRFD